MACITKKRGRLVIDFYDQHGKRRLKTLPEGISKKNARKVLSEIEQMVERGTFLSNIKVPAFWEVAESWLEYKKPNLRASTYEQYQGHIENHLKPYYGLTKITKINFESIEKFIIHATSRGVIKPTLRKLLITLGAILNYATRKRYISFNPMREVEKPKGITRTEQETDFLKPEEIRKLLQNTPDQKYRILFLVAVMSGARQGELLGLKWIDVDWFNNQLQVKRTFNHGKFYEPKSTTSRRSIDLGPTVMNELRKWKLACPPNKLDLVFPNEVGKPINCQNMVNREFIPALRRAGLRQVRFHDLRHSYATLLIAQGEHPKYIQAQMGHSSIKVTMDIYGHLMDGVNQEASKKLERSVLEENGDFLETKNKKGL